MMEKRHHDKQFVCAECGIPTKETYKQYSRGTIKLAQCVR